MDRFHPIADGTGFSAIDSLTANARERLRLRAMQCDEMRAPMRLSGRFPASVFFLDAGFVSIITALKAGTSVCAGVLSARFVVGASALTGTPSNHSYELLTMSKGRIYASSLEDAQREFTRGEEFQHLVLNSLGFEIIQAVQLSACNALHDVMQRLARWLLVCDDAMHATDIFVTHEMVAGALGICRSTATMALDGLRRDGILEVRRGRMRILNRGSLEARACECYFAIQNAYPIRQHNGAPTKPLHDELLGVALTSKSHHLPLQTRT